MTANEEKVLKILKKSKGKAPVLQIAKELGISSGYADLILKALQRQEKIEFSGRWVSLVAVSLPERKKERKKVIKKEVSPKKKKPQKKKIKKPKRKKAVKKPETTTHPPPEGPKRKFGRAEGGSESRKRAPRPERKEPKPSLVKLKGMTKALEKILKKAGYKDVEALAQAPISRLMEDTGLKLKQAANLINRARRVLKIIPSTIPEEKKQKAKEKRGKPKKKKKKKRKEKEPWLIKALKRFFG